MLLKQERLMIENEKQLHITKTAVERLEFALHLHLQTGYDETVDPRIFIAMLEGLQSEIDVLNEQIEEYQNFQLLSLGLIECMGC